MHMRRYPATKSSYFFQNLLLQNLVRYFLHGKKKKVP